MYTSILPKTFLGRWSVGLAIASLLSLALLGVLTGFNPLGAGLNPVLADVLKILLIGISGATFFTGLISVIRRKERSIFTFVGMAIALWFGLGEVAWLFHFSE